MGVLYLAADGRGALIRGYDEDGEEGADEGAMPMKVEPTTLPAVGQHLVTPAWRQVESDLFGALRGR